MPRDLFNDSLFMDLAVSTKGCFAYFLLFSLCRFGERTICMDLVACIKDVFFLVFGAPCGFTS